MWLNLSSLKKNPASSANNESSTDIQITPMHINSPEVPATSEISIAVSGVPKQEKIPATGPKISLMQLKKDSWIHQTVTEVVKQEPIAQNTIEIPAISPEETVPKEEVKTLSDSLSEGGNTDNTIGTIEDNAITDISIIEEVKEEISTEPVSITIPDESASESKDETQEVFKITDTTKELFPNFHIANDLHIDDGLIDMQDVVTIDEWQKSIFSEEETIPKINKEIVSEEEAPSRKEEIISVVSDGETEDFKKTVETPATESLTEPVSEANSTEEISPISLSSAEHVAEVKTELSEQRRAGFRFFTHKKTKILAGVSFVLLSVSAMAFFSGSLFSIDMQKFWKSNIQETVILEPTNTVVENTETIPEMQAPSYEIGRDYSVTKNRKKNIRSKSSSGTLDTSPVVSEGSTLAVPLDGVSLSEATIDETTPSLPPDSSDL